MAVMSAAVVAPLALGDFAYYVTLSAALALVVGLILVIAGIARMGFLADFLAKPVVTGFLFGLALLVIISQLPSLFGLPSGSGGALNQLGQLITSLDDTNPWTLAISVAAFLVLLLFRRYAPGFPGALVVIALGILAVWAFNLQELGVAVVGPIPSGIPSPKIPRCGLPTCCFCFWVQRPWCLWRWESRWARPARSPPNIAVTSTPIRSYWPWVWPTWARD
jgi:MFS superfamily sulfate permease-like transporter